MLYNSPSQLIDNASRKSTKNRFPLILSYLHTYNCSTVVVYLIDLVKLTAFSRSRRHGLNSWATYWPESYQPGYERIYLPRMYRALQRMKQTAITWPSRDLVLMVIRPQIAVDGCRVHDKYMT